MTEELTHLHVLELRLSRARERLALAETDGARRLQDVWIAQMEKEIAAEKEFLQLSGRWLDELPDEPEGALIEALSDDDALLEELLKP